MNSMKTAGMICECNPFHGGHEYLIQSVRASGADCVIALMSGCFVQRGEAAVTEPFLRAQAVMRGGADAVLELPFPFSAASAEYFAGVGVSILERLHVDTLWFGSECGDVAVLQQAAQICESAAFREQYAKTVTDEKGTAEAYFDLLRSFCNKELPCSPNDILAISYLRAILARGSNLVPFTVKREGSAFLDETLTDRSFPSATALRQRWKTDGVTAILPFLPQAAASVYAHAGAPAMLQYAERFILGYFRTLPVDACEKIPELSDGLGRRLIQAAYNATSLEELFALASTKKYTSSRLRRGILYTVTGTELADLHSKPAYVRLLAANGNGRRFLAECRKNCDLPIVTRHIDLPCTTEAMRQAELARRAWGLYTLCYPTVLPADALWKKAPSVFP